MYACLTSYEKTELLTLVDYMSNIAGVLCIYVLCLMRRRNSLPLANNCVHLPFFGEVGVAHLFNFSVLCFSVFVFVFCSYCFC